MTDTIEVIPYNQSWPELFKSEATEIKNVLGKNCIEIHHIGSTSVPGLCAKPIIDLMPVVLNILQVDETNSAMKALGYEIKGEFGIPFRRYFKKNNLSSAFNVHVFQQNSPEIKRHIKFRDWMRHSPADREAYAKLKQDLALKYPNDITSYCIGKDSFIASIEEKIGFNGLRITKALTPQEWKAIRNFRQAYFFDKVPISDPYTWTFNHKDHVHFALYQGPHIIGYAHLQLWPTQRAAMRIIVIDEIYRNKGLGGEFLKLCERWLAQQDILTLHIAASPQAKNFYIKHGYLDMPFNDPDGHEEDPRDTPLGKRI